MSQIFEALSGTLVAAKKRGVVKFEGHLLMQRMHDDVVIELLLDEIEDSPLPPVFVVHLVSAVRILLIHSSTAAQPITDSAPLRPRSNKTQGFDSVAPTGPEYCAGCGKVVYPTERLGVAGKIYHIDKCFTCCQCNTKLQASNFCSVNGKIYWSAAHFASCSLSLPAANRTTRRCSNKMLPTALSVCFLSFCCNSVTSICCSVWTFARCRCLRRLRWCWCRCSEEGRLCTRASSRRAFGTVSRRAGEGEGRAGGRHRQSRKGCCGARRAAGASAEGA